MKYTVKKLAELAGISSRTLHFYDEIDLLKPSYKAVNGYRYYGQTELLKLQQILFFRELQFSLEEIKKIINSPEFNQLKALYEQRKLLELKRIRISGLIKTIDKTIKKVKGEKNMKNDDLFNNFSDRQMKEYKEEAKRRWGNTEAYKQSMERTKNWTKEDYKRKAEEGLRFTEELAKAMDKDIKSAEVQELIKRHHDSIKFFYDCSFKMYRCLGEMYVSDKRFTEYYDRVRPGLAKWLRDAIKYYCDQKEKE